MHRPTQELETWLDHILQAPPEGVIEMIVRRPGEGEREVLEAGELDPVLGLVGDNWKTRGSTKTPDGAADPLGQLTLMNSRVTEAVAGWRERWPPAGDQIYVDMDLSVRNLPVGTRLAVGRAVVEVSPRPHTGCDKFAERYGVDALRFVNIGPGREGRFRGMYVTVIEAGTVRVGDKVTRV